MGNFQRCVFSGVGVFIWLCLNSFCSKLLTENSHPALSAWVSQKFFQCHAFFYLVFSAEGFLRISFDIACLRNFRYYCNKLVKYLQYISNALCIIIVYRQQEFMVNRIAKIFVNHNRKVCFARSFIKRR